MRLRSLDVAEVNGKGFEKNIQWARSYSNLMFLNQDPPMSIYRRSKSDLGCGI